MQVVTPWKINSGFVGVLAVTFFFLGFQNIMFLDPQGIHFMRQADSLAFVSQYYNHGYDFFTPRVFNLESMGGRAASEFPMLYYITSLLYSAVGVKVYLLKIVHFAVASSGVFCVFKMTHHILKDYVYALLVGLFLMTSTVFNYYSLNYLPDPAALGFTFIGWYFFFRVETHPSKKAAIWAVTFFTLGSLIKVTYLISPLSILCYYLLSFLLKKIQLERFDKLLLSYLGIGIFIVVIWNIYVISYNAHYKNDYFTTGARPIWMMSAAEIHHVWDYIFNYWYSKYFAHASFHILLILTLLQIVLFKKANYKMATLTVILFLGGLSYFLLFFKQFGDHDYYFLVLIPIVVFLLINGLKIFKESISHRWAHVVAKLILGALVIHGIDYSVGKLEHRYNSPLDKISRAGLLIKKELKQIKKIKIPDDSKVIVAPDLTKNGGLFFLNREGWMIKTEDEITIDRINKYKQLGAEYLILATNEKESIKTGNRVGDNVFSGTNVHVFDLTETQDNEH